MNGKQLKNSILQWAIQGKLVPQDPNDEPASVLLERIRAEKARLVKEKKIKKDKNESIIYRGDDNSYYEKFLATDEVKCIDEEIPFDIPQGWEWERVGNIFFVTKLAGFEYTKFFTKEALSASNPIPIVRAQNVRMGFFEENKNEAISELLSSQLERSALNKKCLLMTFIGAGIGDTCIFPAERKNHLAPNVAKIEPLDDSISLDYAVFALMSPCGQRGVNAIKKSTAQPSLSMETIRKLLIPIPSLKEQKCISLKLSEAFPLVEKYSRVQEEQNLLNAEIQYLLKKSILQEAIQGKLVPQIADEGTAQELLEQIQQEKQNLFKDGKLKKSALTDSVIFKGDDNKYYEQVGEKCEDITDFIPFDLPSSWIWVRGKSVFMPMESTKPASDFVYIDVDAVNNKINIIDNPKYLKQENAPSRATRKLHKNDLLFSMVRPYLKNIALVDEKYKDAIASTGFYVVTPGLGYIPKFLFYIMLSNYVIDGLNLFMKGDNSPSINNRHIEDYLYPLPPLKEQHRIVAQIEKLFEQLR